MHYAYNSENNLVSANKALKYEIYECPVCGGKLSFHPGKKNKPHFRHKDYVAKEIEKLCELYVPTPSLFNYFEEEDLANQRIRVVICPINNGYSFSLRFPSIEDKFTPRVIFDDIYFNYYCEEVDSFILNNKRLLLSIDECLVNVPLKETYTITCDNPKFEKLLDLNASGKYELFEKGPLLFKNIQGEYRSVHYRQLTLMSRFFVITKLKLKNIPRSIEIISINEINQLYLYDLVMPENLDEELVNWFYKELNYTLLPPLVF